MTPCSLVDDIVPLARLKVFVIILVITYFVPLRQVGRGAKRRRGWMVLVFVLVIVFNILYYQRIKQIERNVRVFD